MKSKLDSSFRFVKNPPKANLQIIIQNDKSV